MLDFTLQGEIREDQCGLDEQTNQPERPEYRYSGHAPSRSDSYSPSYISNDLVNNVIIGGKLLILHFMWKMDPILLKSPSIDSVY